MWVLETEPQSSTRAGSVVDHWSISPALARLTECAAWEKLSIDHIFTQASHLYLVPVLKLSLSFHSSHPTLLPKISTGTVQVHLLLKEFGQILVLFKYLLGVVVWPAGKLQVLAAIIMWAVCPILICSVASRFGD